LNNPLCALLKEIPVIDGNDAHKLCDFLVKVIHIAKVGHFKEPVLYEMLYPYCKGPLVECLNQAISNREKFDAFHARILRRFIPSRQLSLLRLKMYESVQQEGESLETYIRAIKDAALALRINESEAEVVSRVVEGFTPSQSTISFPGATVNICAIGATGDRGQEYIVCRLLQGNRSVYHYC
jgi:hypothetical protein